jgi:hypothetical protein
MDIRFPANGDKIYFKLDFDKPRWFGVVFDGLKVAFWEFKDFFDGIGTFLGSAKSREAGTVPNSCKDGWTKYGGLCYEKCRDGYYRASTMCVQRCPDGWRNDGLFCAKPKAYPRGAGRVMWGGCTGGRERWGALCYPRCRDGYHNAGCCICSPRCPANMHDIGISCAKHTYDTGVGIRMECNSEREAQHGLCYKKCKDDKIGFGQFCWGPDREVLEEHRRRRALGAEHGGPFTLEGLYRDTQAHPIWNSNRTVNNLRGQRWPIFGNTLNRNQEEETEVAH